MDGTNAYKTEATPRESKGWKQVSQIIKPMITRRKLGINRSKVHDIGPKPTAPCSNRNNKRQEEQARETVTCPAIAH